MRVLLIEPHASGHHASYLRWLVQAANRKGWGVVIATTPLSLAHPLLASITVEFEDVQVHPMCDASLGRAGSVGMLSQIYREYSYWRAFKKVTDEAFKTMPFDSVILPYVDYCFYALAVLGAPFRRLPWCGISMRLGANENRLNAKTKRPWKWRMAERLLAEPNLRSLFVINRSVSGASLFWIAERRRSMLRYLPDPAEVHTTVSGAEARATLGVPEQALVILVFGSIDERKGVEALIAGLAARDSLSDCVIVLAGNQSASMRTQLLAGPFASMRAQRRIITLDRIITDADQALILAAADVMWVGYRNHAYMSGVLVLAGRAGLPVVGTIEGEIGKLIIEHNLGVAVAISSPTEVACALELMLDADRRLQIGKCARIAFADHTVENFGRTVLGAFDGNDKG